MSSHEESGAMAKPPISTHKAFVPIVVLWFAALLGLGSLVLPVTQIERLVLLTGISSYVQVIAPPLDMTGRAIVAIVLALLGGALGQVIARRLGNAHSGTAAEEPESDARSPISAHEELGDTAMEDEAPRRSRRLAIAEDAQDEELIELAPLPAASMDDPQPEVEEETPEADVLEPEAEEVEDAAEPVEDNELDLLEEVIEEETSNLDEFDIKGPAIDDLEQDLPAESETESAPSEEQRIEEPQAKPELAEKPIPAPSPCELRPLEELGLIQLVERLGASLEKQRAMRAGVAMGVATITAEEEAFDLQAQAPALVAEPESVKIATEEVIEAELEAVSEEVDSCEPVAEIETAQPAETEAVEVVYEDIAEEGAVAETAEEETALPVEEDTIEAASAVDPEEDASAEPEPQAPLASPFAQFASFEDEEDDDELADLADSFRLPLGNTPVKEDIAENDVDPEEPAPDLDEGEDEEGADGDAEVYGSLLSLRRPFPPEGIAGSENDAEEEREEDPEADLSQPTADTSEVTAVEEEQAATPPAIPSRGPESEAHERALRDALLGLQRLDRAG